MEYSLSDTVPRAVLETEGYTVLTAADGLTGIALTREHPINLVVLDFNMPGVNGSQVAELLMTEQPTLPIVMCSGCPDDVPESLNGSRMPW